MLFGSQKQCNRPFLTNLGFHQHSLLLHPLSYMPSEARQDFLVLTSQNSTSSIPGFAVCICHCSTLFLLLSEIVLAIIDGDNQLIMMPLRALLVLPCTKQDSLFVQMLECMLDLQLFSLHHTDSCPSGCCSASTYYSGLLF